MSKGKVADALDPVDRQNRQHSLCGARADCANRGSFCRATWRPAQAPRPFLSNLPLSSAPSSQFPSGTVRARRLPPNALIAHPHARRLRSQPTAPYEPIQRSITPHDRPSFVHRIVTVWSCSLRDRSTPRLLDPSSAARRLQTVLNISSRTALKIAMQTSPSRKKPGRALAPW